MYRETIDGVFVAFVVIMTISCFVILLILATKLWLTTTVQGRRIYRFVRKNWDIFWQYLWTLTIVSRSKRAAWKWYQYLRTSLPGHPHHMYINVLRADGYDVTSDGAQEFDELYNLIILRRQMKEVHHE